MSSLLQLTGLKFEILYQKSHGFCDTCLGSGYKEDHGDDDWACPDCNGQGVIYFNGFDERSTLARDLWKTIWRAARLHKGGNNPVFEAFNLMTDSMLVSHMLDMTPYQLFELIKESRCLLSDRDAAPQLNMMQYKMACRNGEVSFDEELPF